MLTGFVLQALAAKYFGASPDMDAFLVAFLLLSFLLGQLQSGGLVATAFIPSFNAAIREGAKEARRFFTTACVLTSLLAVCLSLGCLLLATDIVHFLGEGLSPDSAALAVRIFRGLSLLFLPLVLASILSASLRTEGRFLAVAFGPVAINCCIIVSLVLLVPGAGIMSYVWGWSLGILVQCLIVARPLISWPTIDLRLVSLKDPHLRFFAISSSVLFLDAMSGLLLLAVERNMASGLAPGTISHLNYARPLFMIPLRLVVSPAQVVLFALFAQYVAAGRAGELRSTSAKAMRLTVFLVLPAALFIMCFSKDIVQLLYERGQFVAQDTEATATLLTFYALSIPVMALWFQLRSISFALGNVSLPLAASILALVLFYTGNRLFLGPLGAPSLPLTWAAAYCAACLVLGAGVTYRHALPIWGPLLKPLLRLCPAMLAAFGCISAMEQLSLVPRGSDDAWLVMAVRVAAYGTAAGVTYVAVAWAVGVEEVKTISAMGYDRLEKFWRILVLRPKR